MNRQMYSIVTNPVTVVLPIVLILLVGWHFYTQHAQSLSVPSNVNLLPSGDFEKFDSRGLPSGWSLEKHGSLHYSTEHTKGYVGGRAFKLSVSNYKNGDISFVSPKLAVAANSTYLYKGYYAASSGFELVGRYFYKDGSTQVKLLQTYPATTAGTWSTVSDAFRTDDAITGVQYVYHATSDVALQLDGTYFEQNANVYISGLSSHTVNLVPNGRLTSAADKDRPAAWLTYKAGNNVASFSYLHDAGNSFVRVAVSKFKDGEAKWQYQPLPVRPSQYYSFSVDYTSDTAATIVVEYVLQNGHHQFDTLATLAPTSTWTTVSHSFDVPANAVNMFASVVLQSNGTISTDNYQLVNITKPGASHWKRPLVSLTFDDGWHSAYQNATPILAQYNYAGTFYVNPATVATSGFMSAAELKAVHDAGDEVATHGFMHVDMTTIGRRSIDHQLHDGQTYLAEAGFRTRDFAVPYGKTDPEVSWYARKYYDVMRGTGDGINTRQNIDPYNLRVAYVSSSTSQEEFDDIIQQTKQLNGWLIIVYHQVGAESKTTNSIMSQAQAPTISTSEFLGQMISLKRSGIAVETVEDAYKEVQSQ